MKNNFIYQKVKILFEFFIIYILFLCLNILPVRIVSSLGGIILRIVGPLTKINKIVIKNYIKIFPLASKDEITKFTSNSWANTGKTFFELLILPRILKLKNKIKIEGLENLKTVLEKKEKIIFIGIHESNWEILLPTINKIGISVGGIYRHINNSLINNLILKIRKRSISKGKSFYTPKGKKSAKDIIQAISNGLSIVLLVDQKDSAGELVPFFNDPVKTQIGFLKLSRKYKMKIIPVRNKRDKDNNFTLEFYPSLDISSNNSSDIKIMKNIHSLIEGWIKKDPSNYFLQHNRFG